MFNRERDHQRWVRQGAERTNGSQTLMATAHMPVYPYAFMVLNVYSPKYINAHKCE